MKLIRNIILFFLILVPYRAHALTLKQDALILTHTSKHYHTDLATITKTRDLILNSKGQVIALSQLPIESDPLWYGTPLSLIQHEFYSHAGEHSLQFPQDKKQKEFHLTTVGGYLSACLGRTLSTLTSNFIRKSGEMKTLYLHLPMRGIFTGFIEKDHKLVPASPYLESILDSSMDGLTFDQVLSLVDDEKLASFIQETIHIAIYKKSTMMNIEQSEFYLKVQVLKETVFEMGSSESEKQIIVSFE